ncbi:Flp pilus assembly protein CpaB [Herbaspirillum sp. HC18]|nr:Flp pilus assembly protein CpaB [Herbaspirillum sp. HC18]
MKISRTVLRIGISCTAAVAAVAIASQWVNGQSNLKTSKIVVAANDIDLGTRLTPELIRLADWPADSVPAGTFSDIKQLDARVTRAALQRGEPVLGTKLALPGASGGLSAVVADGKRAMTVRVNDVVGVAGFALPGNYVDILVSTQDNAAKPDNRADNRDRSISKLVLERILVLAVAQEASQNDTKPKVVNAVTLEVTPEQAEKLDLARSVGQLSLVLRNQIDLKPAETAGATKDTLLAAADAKPATPAPAAHKPVKRATVKHHPAIKEPHCDRVMTGAGPITQCY